MATSAVWPASSRSLKTVIEIGLATAICARSSRRISAERLRGSIKTTPSKGDPPIARRREGTTPGLACLAGRACGRPVPSLAQIGGERRGHQVLQAAANQEDVPPARVCFAHQASLFPVAAGRDALEHVRSHMPAATARRKKSSLNPARGQAFLDQREEEGLLPRDRVRLEAPGAQQAAVAQPSAQAAASDPGRSC